MNKIREKSPIKRPSPKVVKHHAEYKQDLRKDYFARCGYCNDADYWTGGWRFYQLDHFVPKKYLKTISPTEYSNLVYSCFFCNNSKRAKWPTKDEKVHNNGKEGFVHPVTTEYEDNFERDVAGNIVAKTDLGKYMVKALKLNLKRHAIIWNLEMLDMLIDKIEEEYNKAGNNIPPLLKDQIPSLLFENRKYSKLLRIEGDE